MSAGVCPVTHEFDPLSAPYLADPYPLYDRLREAEPVFHVPSLDLYIVTRYAEVVQVLRDNETFSAANANALFRPLAPEAANILERGYPRKPTFSSADPPRHGKMRAAASRCLTPRRWAASQPALRADMEALIDRIAVTPTADLAADLVTPLVASAGFRLLGFPVADKARLLEWCSKRVLLNYGELDAAGQVDAARAVVEFWNYCGEFIAARQRQPTDDLTSDFLALLGAEGVGLTFEDVHNMVWGIAIASHESTAAAILNGMRRLLGRRDDWNALCSDTSLVPGAVDELLRFDSPVIAHRRLSRVDTTLGGVPIPAGATVVLLLGAANHDPRQFNKAEEFDIRRADANRHLAFGQKWHFCLGAPLARFEYGLVLERLTQRLPDMTLMDRPLQFLPNILIRVMDALPVHTGAPARI